MDVTTEKGRDQDLLRQRQPARGNTTPQTSPFHPNGQGYQTSEEHWSVEQSRQLYGVRNWGQGYFDINNAGNVVVYPKADNTQQIDLKNLVDELIERDIQLPVLIRFTDILEHRLAQ